LKLSDTIRIYLIFYILLLELVFKDVKLTEKIKVDILEGEYKIEAILSLRKKGLTI